MHPNGIHDSRPVPLLVLRHGPVAARHLDGLRANPGVELIEPAGWSPDAVGLARRVSATFVASMSDPLAALAYAVTAGVSGTIVMGVAPRFRGEHAALREAGALGVYTLPLGAGQVDSLLALLDPHPRTAQTDTTLRLTLDPISRVARFRARSVRLSQREFAVLHCLSARGGKPVAADELLREVWGNDVAPGRPRQILDVYICLLRKKLDSLGIVNGIATVRSYGYALNGGAAR